MFNPCKRHASSSTELDDMELAVDQRRLGMTQIVGQSVIERRLRERVLFNGQAHKQIEVAVLSRVQHSDEITLAEQQPAFVFLDEELAEHGFSPKERLMKMGVGLPAERRAAVLHHQEAGRADNTALCRASSVSDVPISRDRFEVMRYRSASRAGGAAETLIAPKCKVMQMRR